MSVKNAKYSSKPISPLSSTTEASSDLVPLSSRTCTSTSQNLSSMTYETLRRRFPEICSSEEFLVSDYICALNQKGLLLQGRIYITSQRLCFYSNIFGHRRRLSLRYEDMARVDKANAGAFLPVGINVISDLGESYALRSFLKRDAAFKDLYSQWSLIRGIHEPYLTPPRGVTSSTIPSLGTCSSQSDVSPDGSYDDIMHLDFNTGTLSTSPRKARALDVPFPPAPSTASCGQNPDLAKKYNESIYSTPPQSQRNSSERKTTPADTNYLAPRSRSLSDAGPTIPKIGESKGGAISSGSLIETQSKLNSKSAWITACQEEIPALVPTLWNVLQGEQEYDAPDILPWHPQGFVVAFMTKKDNISNFIRSNWILPHEDRVEVPVLKFHQIEPGSYRTSTYDVSLASIFFKTTILSASDTSVTFLNETTTQNVPFSSFCHFYTRVSLRQTPENTTKISVSTQLNFFESTPWILKSGIEQAIRLKVRDHYFSLTLALKRLFSRGGLSGYLDSKFGTLALDRTASFNESHSSSSGLSLPPSPKPPAAQASSTWSLLTSERIEAFVGALIWMLVIYGIILTIQMKLQLDNLIGQMGS